MSTPVIIALLLVVLILITSILYILRKKEKPSTYVEERMTLDRLGEYTKRTLAEYLKRTSSYGKNDDEWKAERNRRQHVKQAIDRCVDGLDKDKIIVIDLIKSCIQKKLTTVEQICEVINFQSDFIDPAVKFEILMYKLKKTEGKDAIKYIIDKYHLDKVKFDIENGDSPHRSITSEDISYIYKEEMQTPLTYIDMLEVLAVLVFQRIFGFGCIDTLNEMNVDGILGGVSGSQLSTDPAVPKAARSIWLYFRGMHMHLMFLTFYTQEECRRVVQLVTRYGRPGALTAKRGYIVNTMANHSRVVGFNNSVASYWAFVIRKFTFKDVSVEGLLNPFVIDPLTGKKLLDEHGNYIRKYKNAELVIEFLKYLARALQTVPFTGRQGSGKTTLMIAWVEFLDARYTLRPIEMTAELYLQERYPNRCIISLIESPTVSFSELQDVQKKTNGDISIVGEVATDESAYRMLNTCRIASEATAFSYHSKRAQDTITGLRDSVVSIGGNDSSYGAEQQVLDCIQWDVHLTSDTDGNRYVERITEIIKLDEKTDYPAYDEKNPNKSMDLAWREFMVRTTDRKSFICKDIIVFNRETRSYETRNWVSPAKTEEMLQRMPERYMDSFAEFAQKNWGGVASGDR